MLGMFVRDLHTKKYSKTEAKAHAGLDHLLNIIKQLNAYTFEYIKKEFKQNITQLAEYYRKISKESSKNFDNFFNVKLILVQDILYYHFLEHKNPDLLQILLSENVSPLSQQQINFYLENDLAHEKGIYILQGLRQSEVRSALHEKTFNFPMQTKGNLYPLTCISQATKFISDHIDRPLVIRRLNDLVLKLSGLHAVVNDTVYHFTTIGNFKNILRNGFYSNKSLNQNQIFFKKNALTQSDVDNGDDHVICFAPYLVDYLALFKKNQLFDGLIRLSIDLSKAKAHGKYNQFFKLFDFLAPHFDFTINIPIQERYI